MPPLTIQGNTLGEKHKYFNKLVQDTINSKQFNLTKINKGESDLYNLLQIDSACKTRNVDYIIEVLKCDDMLYVSRAIKHSTWLITEQEYAHVIHPEYLYTQLFPYMLTKAINKLLLHIRLHLKDEKRVEAFYDYIENISHTAEKWLLNCSIPFIENVIQNKQRITLHTYKRICKRSVKFLKYYFKVKGPQDYRALQSVLFFLKSHPEEYLDLLDTVEIFWHPWHTKKSTEIIIKKYPHRILNDFERYVNYLQLPIIAKHLRKEDIRDFLQKHFIKSQSIKSLLGHYENLNPFIENMPEEQRFTFVKETHLLHNLRNVNELDGNLCCNKQSYHWYQYAPFEIAFIELKKNILAESSPAERCAMLSVLIKCAKSNPQYTKIILQYYYNKHRNERNEFKIQFVNNVIAQMASHEFNKECWNILDKLFRSLDVYSKSENNVELCIQAIFVYKVLHDESIPDSVEKKIPFHTFKKLQHKLDKEQNNKIFCYLINSLSQKMQHIEVVNESDFSNAFDVLKNSLNLLIDWNKNITEYTFVLDKFKELIKIRKQSSWGIEMSSLYNMNKSWRRYMFEESMALCPSEKVCLNALKHDPQLLTRHSVEVTALRRDDTISLERFLSKIRIYWPESLAQQWTDAYLCDVNMTTGHEPLIKNLFALLPQNLLIDISKKHVPKDSKINWNELDEKEFKLRKNIAKSLYIARPLISLDTVLWYAKGDYLQYTVPSLNSILHNISLFQTRENISKLLEAPVPLQKHGIDLAFLKLNCNDLKPIFLDILKNTTDSTIRKLLFTHTYNMLCKVKKTVVAREIWKLMNMVFDHLSEENVINFSKLKKIMKIHISVQGDFYMKCYIFLSSFRAKSECESHIEKLLVYAPNIMDLIDADFVVDNILAPVEDKVNKPEDLFIDIISSFVLHGKTEDEQCERSRRTLVPALKHAFAIKCNISSLLNALIINFVKFTFTKKIVIPIKLFAEIKTLMEDKMYEQENYVQYTHWKLITEYVKLFDEHKKMLCDPALDKLSVFQFRNGNMPDEAEKIWEAMHIAISPKMGAIILKHLKEDTKKYFPTICWLFSEALKKLFECLTSSNDEMGMEILEYILDKDFIPSYIVVCEFQGNLEENSYGFIDTEKRSEIRKLLLAHPSKEAQMHFYRALGRRPD